jgi:hypothetical protein
VLQEYCLPYKSKDNEEIWKMGNIGNSAEVSLIGSSLSILLLRASLLSDLNYYNSTRPANLKVACKIPTDIMKQKI